MVINVPRLNLRDPFFREIIEHWLVGTAERKTLILTPWVCGLTKINGLSLMHPGLRQRYNGLEISDLLKL